MDGRFINELRGHFLFCSNHHSILCCKRKMLKAEFNFMWPTFNSNRGIASGNSMQSIFNLHKFSRWTEQILASVFARGEANLKVVRLKEYRSVIAGVMATAKLLSCIKLVVKLSWQKFRLGRNVRLWRLTLGGREPARLRGLWWWIFFWILA